jgi:3-deoxy-D-manno-octulosonic-acid transferase
VVVVDTLGELAGFYALAELAFIGGSLTPRGGQNPLEAVAAGCPVVTGPDIRNFADVVALLEAGRAIRRAADAEGVREAVAALIADPDAGRAQAARARGVLAAHRGATARSLELLQPWLPVPRDRAPAAEPHPEIRG